MALMRVVDRDGVEHEVEARTGLKVMETLRELEYGVAAICGGMCSCATCHVYVDPAWADRLPAPQSARRLRGFASPSLRTNKPALAGFKEGPPCPPRRSRSKAAVPSRSSRSI